jgi:hypothetical protein
MSQLPSITDLTGQTGLAKKVFVTETDPAHHAR